jgi:hypothetical protein
MTIDSKINENRSGLIRHLILPFDTHNLNQMKFKNRRSKNRLEQTAVACPPELLNISIIIRVKKLATTRPVLFPFTG